MAAAAPATTAPAAAPATAADGRKVVDVKLTLDVACPWCFLGQRRLYKALSTLDSKQFDVRVDVLPFLLNADAPTPGADRAATIKAKYGITEEQLQKNHAGLVAKGQDAGIAFGPISGALGNTVNAMRLLTWAGATYGRDKQRALLDAVESQIFEHNQDPSQTAVLLASAKAAGVDEKAAVAFLATSALVEETKKASVEARARGVKTVPNIYVNGVFAADGSQTDFNALLKQVGLVTASA